MHETYREGGFLIAAVKEEEIEHIREWRNSQMSVLRQSTQVSATEQKEYFASKVWPNLLLDQPEQILFSIRHAGEMVGYGGLVHISWINGRAEVSFLLAPEKESEAEFRQAAFTSFLGLVAKIAFQELRLFKLTTETFEFRSSIISTIEAFGFRLEGKLYGQWLIDGERVSSYCHALFAPGVDEGTVPSSDVLTSDNI